MSNIKRLKGQFYQQDTFILAKKLLGKYLVRQDKQQTLIGKIVEVECYYGPDDKASHASRGRTPRTELMFKQAGLAYIYLIYGMYYCFNIVTETKDFPAAILIRALEPVSGLPQMLHNRKLKNKNPKFSTLNFKILTSLSSGPGKLCQALKIDKSLNGENLITSKKLYLAENPQERISTKIIKAKRIGVDYAGQYKHKPWRYYLKNNPFVSKI